MSFPLSVLLYVRPTCIIVTFNHLRLNLDYLFPIIWVECLYTSLLAVTIAIPLCTDQRIIYLFLQMHTNKTQGCFPVVSAVSVFLSVLQQFPRFGTWGTPLRNLSSRPDDLVICLRSEKQMNTKDGRKTQFFTLLNFSGSEPDVVPDFKKCSTCPAGDSLLSLLVTLRISSLG